MNDKPGMHMLMEAQMRAELETYDKLYLSRRSLYMLINALSGIASNATACGACRMGNDIASKALEKFEHATGIKPEHAYQWMRDQK